MLFSVIFYINTILSSSSWARESEAVTESCKSPDPRRVCLALKYIVFQSEAEPLHLDQSKAISNVRQVNQIWMQCGIQFEIEDFEVIPPSALKLSYRTSSFPELDQVRSAFGNNHELLIVTTGAWDGALGAGKANAWTTLPGGSGPFGAVIERKVATYPNIIAHELGHYLNLSHAARADHLMNPVIYEHSTYIPGEECAQARYAAGTYWSAMLR